jgi:hypothetical protein
MCLSAISSSGMNLIIVFVLFIEPCVRPFHSRPSHQQSKRIRREVEESKKTFQLVRVTYFARGAHKNASTDLICREPASSSYLLILVIHVNNYAKLKNSNPETNVDAKAMLEEKRKKTFFPRRLHASAVGSENETIGLTLGALHVSLFILLNTSNEY